VSLPAADTKQLTTSEAAPLRVEETLRSSDGTSKLAMRTVDGRPLEAVLMRFERGGAGMAARTQLPPRFTACLSSQSGCALKCTFCATGAMGLGRSLSADEIVAQLDALAAEQQDRFGGERPRIDNVVMMGMGEPMHNLDAVLDALRQLSHARGHAIAPRRMTISTVGWVPGIQRLAAEPLPVRLALSLHAADDQLRSELMPVNRRYALAELMRACADYCAVTSRAIYVEYLLLDGVNDSCAHARALADLLLDTRGAGSWHVNLIAYNPVGTDYVAAPRERVDAFRALLRNVGLQASYRVSRGSDIAGACGQLAARTSLTAPT
jgi:23S rRNA (adenine2503-C2)-methyltransferase